MTPAAHSDRKGASRTNLLWLVGYIVAIAGLVVFVLHLRDTILRDLDTPEAHAEWQAWREAPPNSDATGPVRRKPPSAAEPPALLLMRDHFTVVMSGSVLFSSLLFAAVMMAVRGVFSNSRTPGDESRL
jgi:hypothetical protein